MMIIHGGGPLQLTIHKLSRPLQFLTISFKLAYKMSSYSYGYECILFDRLGLVPHPYLKIDALSHRKNTTIIITIRAC